MAPEYKFKMVMLGDFAVGKTSIIRRFVFDEFGDTYLTTIGVKVTRKEAVLKNGAGADLLLWDIAGSDRFNEVSPEYVKGASAGIIVADVTRPSTIDSIQTHAEMIGKNNPEAVIAVALNKSDLSHDTNSVMKTARDIIDKLGLNWYPSTVATSAKTGKNVNELLISLAEAAAEFGDR